MAAPQWLKRILGERQTAPAQTNDQIAEAQVEGGESPPPSVAVLGSDSTPIQIQRANYYNPHPKSAQGDIPRLPNSPER